MNRSFLSSEDLGETKCPINGGYSQNLDKSEEGIITGALTAIGAVVIGPYLAIALIVAIVAICCGVASAADKKFVRKCASKVKPEDWKRIQDYCFKYAESANKFNSELEKKIASLFPASYSRFSSIPVFDMKDKKRTVDSILKSILKGLKKGDDTMEFEVEIWFEDNNNYGEDGDGTYEKEKFDKDSAKANKYLDSLRGKTLPGLQQKIENLSYGYDYPDDNYVYLTVDVTTLVGNEVKAILDPIFKTVKETKVEYDKENK